MHLSLLGTATQIRALAAACPPSRQQAAAVDWWEEGVREEAEAQARSLGISPLPS